MTSLYISMEKFEIEPLPLSFSTNYLLEQGRIFLNYIRKNE